MTQQTVEVQEFAVNERVLASIDTTLETGERFTGPLLIGSYPDDNSPELWIEQEGRRVQFPPEAVPHIIKQLRRAVAIETGSKQ